MTIEATRMTISAIISNEKVLENLVNELIEVAVDRHQISIQGSPEQLTKAYGQPYIDPDIIQHSPNAPTQEPFLMDDFGWILAYAFTIPLVIGVIIGVFLIGDLFSVADNFLYGAIGGILGGIAGLILHQIIKSHREKKNRKQEVKGGFVIWIQIESEAQIPEIVAILNKYQAVHIESKMLIV